MLVVFVVAVVQPSTKTKAEGLADAPQQCTSAQFGVDVFQSLTSVSGQFYFASNDHGQTTFPKGSLVEACEEQATSSGPGAPIGVQLVLSFSPPAVDYWYLESQILEAPQGEVAFYEVTDNGLILLEGSDELGTTFFESTDPNGKETWGAFIHLDAQEGISVVLIDLGAPPPTSTPTATVTASPTATATATASPTATVMATATAMQTPTATATATTTATHTVTPVWLFLSVVRNDPQPTATPWDTPIPPPTPGPSPTPAPTDPIPDP